MALTRISVPSLMMNRRWRTSLRALQFGLTSLALAACGGGDGGGGDGGGLNAEPTARFSVTPACGQAPMAATFDASESIDVGGSIVAYDWIFGDGGTASGKVVNHTYATAGTFTAALTVTDDDGARAVYSVPVTTISGPLPANVSVSGTISFERVPFAATLGNGLDFTRTFEAPAREVEVELLRASDGAVLQTTLTNSLGQYQFAAPLNTNVLVRARAVSRPAAAQAARWNIRVLDNTNSDALYALDGSAFSTCVVDQTRNLKAATGWAGGFSGTYSGTRAAAPFAILDTLYAATQFVVSQGDNGVQLKQLNAYWSPANVPSSGDFDAGRIGTTSYWPPNSEGVEPGIYVLGAANNDTDEFDAHVIAHEYLHYLEDAVSRSDTTGGPHSLDERLDMRLAFSEGFGNAYSAMVLGDATYRDSFGTAQGDDYNFSVESRATSAPGWYNETSAQRILWDLFDTTNDGVDQVSLGFGPLYDVLTTELRDDVPLTSLFPFISALKQRAGVPVAAVDQLVEAEQVGGASLGIVSTTMTPYAATETHSGVLPVSTDLVLPIYTPIALGGSARVCASSSIETAGGTVEGIYNLLGNRRFLRFSVPGPSAIRIRVTCDVSDASCGGSPLPDPDFVVSQGPQVTVADSDVARVEQFDLDAANGDYVLEVYDYSHANLSEDNPRGRTCMTVTLQ